MSELICPCRTNFAFKMIINTVLCCFTCSFKLLPCGCGAQNTEKVATRAELITGTCLRLICPCRTNFAFKTIKNIILCCFHLFFKIISLWLC